MSPSRTDPGWTFGSPANTLSDTPDLTAISKPDRENAVDATTAERSKHSLGPLVNEGKTKKIHQIAGNPDLVTLVSKDDITAGDGAKHDVISGKSALANGTTCNVFRLLKACGIPVAFEEQDSATSFIAPKCHMLPYEVVTRREAHGSYLKRHPQYGKG